MHPAPSPVVHLELHTANLARACDVYRRLCGWRVERIEAGPGAYHAFDWGEGRGGGVVECGTRRAVWLPYVEVGAVDAATDVARRLGATVLLEPREGPAGWRSIVSLPDGGELGFWQAKPRAVPRSPLHHVVDHHPRGEDHP